VSKRPDPEDLFERLREPAERWRSLQEQLADPEVHGQAGKAASLLRELATLQGKAETWERWQALVARREAAEALLADRDGEVVGLAREELVAIQAQSDAMVAELERQLADDDPMRGRTVMLEIRAGTGGDEASLFAGDLMRMYGKFVEAHGCRLELLASSSSEVGGFKEVVLAVSGTQAWDLLRHESGGHRVQRVPDTESQGRIHTSAATVAVLPEAEEVEVEIRDQDLRIDTYRAGGPGGQAVNKISSAIRITHLPTGTVVQCQDETSQHKNKSKAMRMLRTRLLEAQQAARKQAEDSSRRTQIGSGDRSERVRTYNWPQNRVTDHRTKASYNLETVVAGGLDEVVEDLRRLDLQQKLAALAAGEL
jgi:peptide chain release factor 1